MVTYSPSPIEVLKETLFFQKRANRGFEIFSLKHCSSISGHVIGVGGLKAKIILLKKTQIGGKEQYLESSNQVRRSRNEDWPNQISLPASRSNDAGTQRSARRDPSCLYKLFHSHSDKETENERFLASSPDDIHVV